MISITSDIHHQTLGTGNQKHCDISEIKTAILMHQILKSKNLKATYFISGKSFEEEWDDLKNICGDQEFDIGGHNYFCFKPELYHRVTNKLFNSYNGHYSYQKWETKKTQNIIKEKVGRDCVFWRNHMYMHGKYTDQVLQECGIKICSDGVQKNVSNLLEINSNYFHLPINIIPDHEHLIHAERTPEWIAEWQKRYNWSDDFGSESYYIEEWSDLVIEQIRENEKNNRLSNLIIHPITMYLCDEFKSFEKILNEIQKYEVVNFSDIYNQKEKLKAA